MIDLIDRYIKWSKICSALFHAVLLFVVERKFIEKIDVHLKQSNQCMRHLLSRPEHSEDKNAYYFIVSVYWNWKDTVKKPVKTVLLLNTISRYHSLFQLVISTTKCLKVISSFQMRDVTDSRKVIWPFWIDDIIYSKAMQDNANNWNWWYHLFKEKISAISVDTIYYSVQLVLFRDNRSSKDFSTLICYYFQC